MAKTESTAVNALIDLVQSGKPMAMEPEHDAELMFGAPKAAPVGPARMTATIPPMRGAGEVEPLPRGRAPTGTSQHQLPAMPPPARAVRMMTAPPSRAATIPPIPSAKSAPVKLPEIPPAPVRPPVTDPLARPGVKNTLPLPNRLTPPAPSANRMTPPPASANPPPVSAKGTLPPPTAPVAAPFEPTARTRASAPLFETKRAPAEGNPFVAVPLHQAARTATIDKTGDPVSAEGWFEASRAVEKVDETWIGTRPVERQHSTFATVKKLIAPTAVLVVIGVMIGGYIAFDGEGNKARHAPKLATVPRVTAPAPAPAIADRTESAAQPSRESANAATATAGGDQPQPPTKEEIKARPAPAAEVQAAPAPAPVAVVAPAPAPAAVAAVAPSAHQVQPTRGVVKLAEVRFDTRPAGATVMLVDNGKTSFLGTTPVAASLDPSRTYDVIFTLDGHPTQMTHLDPAATQRLDVSFDKAVPQAKAAAPARETAAAVRETAPARETAAPAPARRAKAKVSSGPVGGLVEPSFDMPAPAKADKKSERKLAMVEPATGGTGTLMVSSKPPCDILVDGKVTGLTTPQRSLPLSAGPHKITFVNAQENIKKTVSVSITADHSTRLIEDLLKK